MILSRRRIYNDDNNIKIPYIKKDLHLMFDGIWNAGIGIHDSTVTNLWKNLAGNIDMELAGTVEWNNDNLIVIGSSTGKTTTNTRGLLKLNDLYAGDIGGTFELVLSLASHHNYSPMFRCNDNFECWVPSDANMCYRVNGTACYAGSNKFPANTKAYWAFTYTNGSLKAYKNGTQVKSATTGSNFGIYGKFWFMGVYNDGSRWSNGNWYAIRHYNRVLTADEILNNYNIDKQRFNL